MTTPHQVGRVSTVTVMYAEIKVEKASEKIQIDQGTSYQGQRMGDFVKDLTDIFRIGDEVTFLEESLGNFTRVTDVLNLKTLGAPLVETYGYIEHYPEKAKALLITKEYGKLVFFQEHVVRTWNIPNDKSPFSDVCLRGYTARAKLFANPNIGWSVLSVMLLTPPDALESGFGIINDKKTHAIIESDTFGVVLMPHLRILEPKGWTSWTAVDGQQVHFFAVDNIPGFPYKRVAIRAHFSSKCSLYHTEDFIESVQNGPIDLGEGKDIKTVLAQSMAVHDTRNDLEPLPLEILKGPVVPMESKITKNRLVQTEMNISMHESVQTVEVLHPFGDDDIRQQLREFMQEFRAALCISALFMIALFILFDA